MRRRAAGAWLCPFGHSCQPSLASELERGVPRQPARKNLGDNFWIAPSARRGQRICPSAMPSCALADTPATSWGRGNCCHHLALCGYRLLHFRAIERLRRSWFAAGNGRWPKAAKRVRGISPYPSKNHTSCYLTPPYVVPVGISRGSPMLSTIARKIAVSLVRFWLLGAVASQPSASSE